MTNPWLTDYIKPSTHSFDIYILQDTSLTTTFRGGHERSCVVAGKVYKGE